MSTNTAEFVGLKHRGRASGLLELVTRFADFQRKFGGYLGNVHENDRFLPYSVDAFFTKWRAARVYHEVIK